MAGEDQRDRHHGQHQGQVAEQVEELGDARLAATEVVGGVNCDGHREGDPGTAEVHLRPRSSD
jgi:hypothetical protein